MTRFPADPPTPTAGRRDRCGRRLRRPRLIPLIYAAGSFAVALPADAQSAGRGFLFREPLGSFALRGGFARPSVASEIFSFSMDSLTLDKGDFGAFDIGADLAFWLTPRFDLVIGAGYSGSSSESEFREWVDQNDQPIEQTTDFTRVPVTASMKAYLVSRGRSIGRFAWLPAQYAPYVGAGGGVMWYRFRQVGDFVDFQTLDVFSDDFEASRWTAMAHGMVGMDYSLGPRFALTGEGRYVWAKAKMGEDFVGFDKIDLSGFSATLGLLVRF